MRCMLAVQVYQNLTNISLEGWAKLKLEITNFHMNPLQLWVDPVPKSLNWKNKQILKLTDLLSMIVKGKAKQF